MLQRIREWVRALVTVTGSVLLLLAFRSSAQAMTPAPSEGSAAAASAIAADAASAIHIKEPPTSAAPIIQRPIRVAAAYSPVGAWRPQHVEGSSDALPERVIEPSLPSYIDTILMIVFGTSLIAYPLVRKQRALLRSALTDL